MKKPAVLLFFFFLCLTLSAQEEVTFNFSRENLKYGAKIPIKVFVNGVAATSLKNGEKIVYKVKLDPEKPVVVQARFSQFMREIGIKLSPGNVCNIETNAANKTLNLKLLSGGVRLQGTGRTSDLKGNKKDYSLTYTLVSENATDTIRQQWLDVGGKIGYRSIIGNASFMSLTDADMKLKGFGAGFNVTNTRLNFRVPEFKPGIQTWNSGLIGITIAIQASGTTITIPEIKPMKSGSLMETLSLNAGYTLGVGKFKNQTKWKGVAFDLTYRPSVMMTVSSEGDSKPQYNLNLTGFGFDVNFNSFTSNAARIAPKAQSKLTFFVLPPVKNMPLFITVGYGLSFYDKFK